MIIGTMLVGCVEVLMIISGVEFIKNKREEKEIHKRFQNLKSELNEKRKELYSLMSDETEDS